MKKLEIFFFNYVIEEKWRVKAKILLTIANIFFFNYVIEERGRVKAKIL